MKKSTEELQKKWHDSCLHLHPKFHQQSLSTERISPTPFPMMGMCKPNFLARQLQPKLQLNKNLGSTPQLSSNPVLPSQPSEQVVSPPGSPVRTELALGQTKVADSTPDQTNKERVMDFLGTLTSESQDKFNELQSSKLLDAESYKKLLKGLAEVVWWQQDAASAVATAVTRCKLGNGKTRRGNTKGDMWLLFVGPDRVGKQKMAAALSELVSRSNPIIISVGPRRDDGESDVHVRGKTALDRIAEAIRRNPFSVIMLEDIDEADLLIRGSIKRAMERGRFIDSHGREISLGNVVFILTASWLPDNLKYLPSGTSLDEERFASLAKSSWQLRLSLSKKTTKRRPSWLSDEDRSTKPRKETNLGLAFDLNEAADAEDDRADGSLNSSDLTVDHEDNQVLNNGRSLTSLVPRELLDAIDDTIVFRPVEFSRIRRNFRASILKKFSSIIGNGFSIEVQEEALAKIASGVWLGQTSIDEWMEKVMVPSFQQLKTEFNASSNSDESFVVKLEEDDGDSDSRRYSEWLPDSVRVVVEGC